ncbi:MBL fold metallo-hydrolase [Patescibacteria group bacterium]
MNKIIFLGTGCAINLQRHLTSLLLVSKNRNVLLDCGDGMGTIRNIHKAGIRPESIKDVVLTHHHADHIIGITHFLLLWLIKNKNKKIRIFGSRKTLKVAKDISFTTHDYTRQNSHRIAFVPIKPWEELRLSPGLFIQPAVVKGASKSSPLCYAYKIKLGKNSIVFSADMQPNKNFEKLASGASIVIHETSGLDRDKDFININGHSTARDAGTLASRSKAKKLVLIHLPEFGAIKESDFINEAKMYFGGEVILAEDMMELIL